MRAGKLGWRVSIEAPVYDTGDPYGQANTPSSWTTLGTFWMDIRPLTGREQVVASQMVATSTHVFTMRYSSSGAVGISIVNPTHRLNFRGRIFHVDQPPKDPDEQNRQLDIYCTEQVVPV